MIDAATRAKLAAPFPPGAISVKPGATTEKNGQKSGMVLSFVDARAVEDRLDDAFEGAWSFTWEPQPEYSNGKGNLLAVKGTITACGITRQDVGQANGEEEPYKAAVSDALKRTAVQLGVGRYLYDMPTMWWPMDGKYFTEQDRLQDLMGELSAEVAAGKEIDMRRYRYTAPTQQRKAAGPEPATPEQIQQLRDLITPRLVTIPEKRDFFMRCIQAYPQDLTKDLTKQEAQILIGAAAKLPIAERKAA